MGAEAGAEDFVASFEVFGESYGESELVENVGVLSVLEPALDLFLEVKQVVQYSPLLCDVYC